MEKELWMKTLFSLSSLKVEKGERYWYHWYWASSIERLELPGWVAQPRVKESKQLWQGWEPQSMGNSWQQHVCWRWVNIAAQLLIFSTVCGFLSLHSSILLNQKKLEQRLCVFLVFSSHVSCFLRLVATAVVTLHLSSFCSKWKGQTCF